MPAFIAALLGGLLQLVGSFVGRVMISLGLSFATYTGVDTVLNLAKAQLLTGITGLPATAVAVASSMKLGVCISILTSALAARLLMAGLQSGTVKRWVQG